jgi:hypothetical protein
MDENKKSPDRKRKTIRSQDVQGLKYFKSISKLLQRLHKVGTQRDKAHNRQLHMDQYCMLVLIWMYSPILTSLRGVQQASTLQKVQKKLGVPKTSLGSLSESVQVFDPEQLKEIAKELGDQLPLKLAGKQPKGFDPSTINNLQGLGKTITAVDGSIVQVLARIAELSWIKVRDGAPTCGYRLHTQFEVLRGIPNRIDATSANPKGEADERKVLERTLEPDRLYVMDRGYQKWGLWNAIHSKGSSYVCRARNKTAYEVVEDRPLSQADTQAGVLSDQIIKPTAEGVKMNHSLRIVMVRGPVHTSRGRRRGRNFSSTGPSCDGVVRLITDMLDVPAELIAAIYSLRWLVELFFKMFKHLLGCRHLLSTKQNGVEIQVYCAIIACMLILLHTGRTPTKRTFEMICFYMMGWASLEELERHIEKLKSQAN